MQVLLMHVPLVQIVTPMVDCCIGLGCDSEIRLKSCVYRAARGEPPTATADEVKFSRTEAETATLARAAPTTATLIQQGQKMKLYIKEMKKHQIHDESSSTRDLHDSGSWC